MKIKCSLDT